MELTDLLSVLRTRWLVLVTLAAIGGALGYVQYTGTEPVYRSTAKMWVSPTRGDTTAEWVQGQTYTQNLVASVAALATTPAVLQPVVDELGLETTAAGLAGLVSADSPVDLMFVEVTAVHRDPARAAAIANAVARQLATMVQDVTPRTNAGEPSIALTVVTPAAQAAAPFSPRLTRSVGVPAAAGLALGFVIALLLARLDTRVRGPEDFPSPPERARLGAVPRDRRLRSQGPAVLVREPRGALTEAYRRVHTNLRFVTSATGARLVVVTSSVPGEGKSTTALALAMAMAEKRRRVLLVDADLRRPSIARMCGLESEAGLSTVLVGEAGLEDVVQPWGPPGLHVLPAGHLPPNPSQLVDSAAMARLLEHARDEYDVVLVDTPPMLVLTDAAVLAKHSDGVVVVVGHRKVRRNQLAETVRQLDAIEVNVLGLVSNGERGRSTEFSPYDQERHGLRGGPGRSRPVRAPRDDRTTTPPPAPAASDDTAGEQGGTEPTSRPTTEESPETARSTPAVSSPRRAADRDAGPARTPAHATTRERGDDGSGDDD